MGEKRVAARTSFKRQPELTATHPRKKVAPPSCADVPKRAAAAPATQTRRAGQGFRDAGGDGKNSSRAFAAAGEEAALVLHSKAANAGDLHHRDSSQNVVCGKGNAAAPAASAMNGAGPPVRRTGSAASFKKMVSIKDREAAASHDAVAGADACTPKASPAGTTNPKPSSGRVKEIGNDGRKRARRGVVFLDEPWRSSPTSTKLAPFSPRGAVQERLRLFRDLAVEQQRGREAKPDLMALKILKQRGRVPTRKYLGDVPGVEVGDEFHYRSELVVAGLHGCPFVGIDSMPHNGTKVATCVVSAKRYVNVMEGADVLVYSGEGGIPGFWEKKGRKEPAGDQRLDCGGNLALKNSMETQQPVRVVHGFSVARDGEESLESRASTAVRYVYDGLYRVEHYWWETTPAGFRVLKFRMRRAPGQRELELEHVWRRPAPAEAGAGGKLQRHDRCKEEGGGGESGLLQMTAWRS